MDSNTCRLWIGAWMKVDVVEACLAGEIADQFKGLAVAFNLDRNDGFDPRAGDTDDFIVTSAWTAWLEALPSDPLAVESFQAGICRLIVNLRTRGFAITTACDFEDRVVAETGWNWTAGPLQPPV